MPTAVNFFARVKKLAELYADRRLLIIFVLGICSGFPWVLIGKAATVWLQEAGLSRTDIGLFGGIYIVYALNFLWAPLVDRLRLPRLCALGQRRSWILLCLLVIFGATLLLSGLDPRAELVQFRGVALLLALASATQDIVIDAYRIERIKPIETPKVSAAAAMAVSGWWTGFGGLGGAALFLSDLPGISWAMVYGYLAIVVLLLIGVVLLIAEPPSDPTTRKCADEQSFMQADKTPRLLERIGLWCMVTLMHPLREFWLRHGWSLAISILGFIFLFKLGEAFLGRMAIVFYKEIGFSNTEIAVYSSFVGWWVTAGFTLIGSIVSIHYGLVRGLLLGGIAMAATNLLFSGLAWVGPSPWLFVTAVVLDNFTSACATVAFVAFISHLTSRAYTATQYALMASLGNLGRTTLALGSGALVDYLDGNWALFFILTTLLVLPSLVLLRQIGARVMAISAP